MPETPPARGRRLAPLVVAALATLVAVGLLARGDGPDPGSGAPRAEERSPVLPDLRVGAPKDATPVLALQAAPAAAPEPSRGARYVLQVFVEDARAHRLLPGARVVLTLQDGVVVERPSDARGIATFPDLGVPPRSVVAHAEGFESGVVHYVQPEIRDLRILARLWPAAGLDVQVVAMASGRAVEGARVRLVALEPFRWNKDPYSVSGEFEVGVTDARGQIRVPLRSAAELAESGQRYVNSTWLLDVWAPGLRRTWCPLPNDASRATEPHVVQLAPGTDLVGTATDESGRPLAGVAIEAAPTRIYGPRGLGGGARAHPEHMILALPPGTEVVWMIAQRAVSDADGHFRIEGLGLGEDYDASASLPGHAPVLATALRAAAGGGEMRWDPLLPHGARLEVLVVDPDGRPIPRVDGSVSAKRGGGGGGRGETDAHGLLTFDDLRAGVYDVALQAQPGPGTPTNEYGQVKYEIEKGWNLEVRSGEVKRVTLVMPYGTRGDPERIPVPDTDIEVRGRVVTENGEPLSNVLLTSIGSRPVGVTDGHGRFEARVDRHVRVWLGEHGDWATGETFTPPTDGSPWVIVARRAAPTTVELVVEVPDDAPPPHEVRWTLTPAEGTLPEGRLRLSRSEQAAWPAHEARRFVVPAQAAPGPLDLRLEAEGFETHEGRLEVSPSAGPSAVRVRLARGRVVRGHVVNERGEPVAGAQVLASGLTRRATAVTDSEGRFEVSPLDVEPVTYEVSAAGHLAVLGSLSPGPHNIFDGWLPPTRLDPSRIVLARAARVRVRVLGTSGHALAWIKVRLERVEPREDGDEQARPWGPYGYTGLDGTLTLAVAPGAWAVKLPSGSSETPPSLPPSPVEAVVGETVEVRLVVPGR